MGEDKDYKVIHEKIIPKKHGFGKKFLKYGALLLCSAAVFGLVERAVFESSGLLWKKNKKQNIELMTDRGSQEQEKIKKEDTEPKKIVEATKTIVKKDIKVVEKKIDANLFDYSDIMRAFGKVAEEKNKSVVEIQTVVMGTDWFKNPYEAITSTAGFIMAIQEDQIYIMTRYSKIKNDGNIKVLFYNGLLLDGKLRNYHQDLDLAIISTDTGKIMKEEKEEFTALEIPSNEYIYLGRPVMALGNPDGNMYSVFFGKVINTKGSYYQADYVFDAFYTDLRLVKDGFSFVLDIEGKVLGIGYQQKEGNSSKILAAGRVVKLIEHMINDEGIPYLGIITKKFDGAEGKTGRVGGILVDKLVKNSPADQAGFKEGDIIYEFGGKQIESIVDYLDILETKKVGEMVRLKIYRVSRNVGSEHEIEAIIGDSRGVK